MHVLYTNLDPRLGVGGVERHGEDRIVGRDGHGRVLTRRNRFGDLVTIVVVDSEHVDGGGHSVCLAAVVVVEYLGYNYLLLLVAELSS